MTKNTLTVDAVMDAVKVTTQEIIDDLGADPDTDREALIERMDEECDALFGQLVYMGRIDLWDAQTLARHAGECATIIEAAERHAWVEDDEGLWQGVTYGVVACIAFYSLRNLLYQAMKDAGHDSNDDRPFAAKDADEAD